MPEGCRDRLAGEYIYWQWQAAVPACPVPQILLSDAPAEEGRLPNPECRRHFLDIYCSQRQGQRLQEPPRILAEEYVHAHTVNPAMMELCLDLPAFQTHPDQLPQAQTQFCLPGA